MLAVGAQTPPEQLMFEVVAEEIVTLARAGAIAIQASAAATARKLVFPRMIPCTVNEPEEPYFFGGGLAMR